MNKNLCIYPATNIGHLCILHKHKNPSVTKVIDEYKEYFVILENQAERIMKEIMDINASDLPDEQIEQLINIHRAALTEVYMDLHNARGGL
jgi:hypothetical protein